MVLKLNGGLGTSMGMTRAKSLLEVKDGHPLDDRAPAPASAGAPRGTHSAALMDSFATRDDTLAALEPYAELAVEDCRSTSFRAACPRLADGTTRSAGPTTRRSSGRCRATARCSPRSRPPGCWPSSSSAATATVHLQRGQPRRGARPAHPRLVRRRGAAIRLRGGGPHRGRQEGRPSRPPALQRRVAARDGPGAGRGPRGLRGHLGPPLLQRQQHLGEPRALERRSSRAAACSSCR